MDGDNAPPAIRWHSAGSSQTAAFFRASPELNSGSIVPIAVPTADDTPAVRLTDVRLDRGGRAVLRDIALSVPRGSVTAVLGPSGSGKSTLLAALTGELVPASG